MEVRLMELRPWGLEVTPGGRIWAGRISVDSPRSQITAREVWGSVPVHSRESDVRCVKSAGQGVQTLGSPECRPPIMSRASSTTDCYKHGAAVNAVTPCNWAAAAVATSKT